MASSVAPADFRLASPSSPRLDSKAAEVLLADGHDMDAQFKSQDSVSGVFVDHHASADDPSSQTSFDDGGSKNEIQLQTPGSAAPQVKLGVVVSGNRDETAETPNSDLQISCIASASPDGSLDAAKHNSDDDGALLNEQSELEHRQETATSAAADGQQHSPSLPGEERLNENSTVSFREGDDGDWDNGLDESKIRLVGYNLADEWKFLCLRDEQCWLPHRWTPTKNKDSHAGLRAVIAKAEKVGAKTNCHTVYIIFIKTAFSLRSVARRYSEFARLDNTLRASRPDLPQLPKKKLFATTQPRFVEERKKQLQRYLNALLSRRDVVNSAPLRLFLSLSDDVLKKSVTAPALDKQGADLAFSALLDSTRADEYLSEAELIMARNHSSPITEALANNSAAVWMVLSVTSPSLGRLSKSGMRSAARTVAPVDMTSVTPTEVSFANDSTMDLSSLSIKNSSTIHEGNTDDDSMAVSVASQGSTREDVLSTAANLFSQSASLCIAHEHALGALISTSNLAAVLTILGESRRGGELFNRTVQAAAQLNSPSVLGLALLNLCFFELACGNDSGALEAAQAAIEAAKEEHADGASVSVGAGSVPPSPSQTEDESEALEAANNTNMSSVHESLPGQGAALMFLQVAAFEALGLSQRAQGGLKLSVEAFESCMSLYQKRRDKHGLAATLFRLGNTFTSIAYHVHAVGYFEQCLVLCQELGDLSGEVETLRLLADIAFHQGELETASEHLRQAVRRSHSSGDCISEAISRTSLAAIHTRNGEHTQAVRVLEEGSSAADACHAIPARAGPFCWGMDADKIGDRLQEELDSAKQKVTLSAASSTVGRGNSSGQRSFLNDSRARSNGGGEGSIDLGSRGSVPLSFKVKMPTGFGQHLKFLSGFVSKDFQYG